MTTRRSTKNSTLENSVTDEAVYRDRRRFLLQSAGVLTGLGLLSRTSAASAAVNPIDTTDPDALKRLHVATKADMAGGEKPTSLEAVTHYNNFYEFGVSKSDPAENAGTLITRPWEIKVDGECDKPGSIAVDDFIPYNKLEERIYRHRCVEGWSIVVPWVGFPLATALKRFKPTSKARYVAFETLYSRKEMPQAGDVLPWPYREGLRIDEAMHPLTFLSVGLYGRVLPNQNGAPIRLTVPWKYGYKSIKSIVRISFVETMPPTTWNTVAPGEYGFYSNVNPNVSRTPWSQATEKRLGHFFSQKTLMFNGYEQVAPLYAGMNLERWY